MRSYRALKLLAERLCGDGFTVLRFDYAATGESQGESQSAQAGEWVENIKTAIDEVRRQPDTDDVCLIGLRLGGLLAMAALDAGAAASRLLAWDVPASGAAWYREMRHIDQALHVRWDEQRSRAAKLAPPTDDELLGASLPQGWALIEAMTARLPSRVTVCCTSLYSADTASALATKASATESMTLPDSSHWADASWATTPWLPAASMAVVAAYLADRLS